MCWQFVSLRLRVEECQWHATFYFHFAPHRNSCRWQIWRLGRRMRRQTGNICIYRQDEGCQGNVTDREAALGGDAVSGRHRGFAGWPFRFQLLWRSLTSWHQARSTHACMHALNTQRLSPDGGQVQIQSIGIGSVDLDLGSVPPSYQWYYVHTLE